MLAEYDEGVTRPVGDSSPDASQAAADGARPAGEASAPAPPGADSKGFTLEDGYAAGVLRQARKLVVLVVGSVVVVVGVAMLVLPGPAFLVIPAGIAILATEFDWARRLLRKVKARIRLAAKTARQKARARSSERGDI